MGRQDDQYQVPEEPSVDSPGRDANLRRSCVPDTDRAGLRRLGGIGVRNGDLKVLRGRSRYLDRGQEVGEGAWH